MAAHGGHTRASGGRTVKMNVPVPFPLGTSHKKFKFAQRCGSRISAVVAKRVGWHTRRDTTHLTHTTQRTRRFG